MKKTMLWSALFALMSAQIQAEKPTTPAPDITTTIPAESITGAQTLSQNDSQIQPQTIQAPPPPKPVAPMPTAPAAATQPTTTPAPTALPAIPPTINCEYKIPASTKTIEPDLIVNWSEKATAQAFQFDPNNLDEQLQKLQTCFTDQGWVGFKNALQKSGNIEAIRSQKLNVSNQLNGKAQITDSKDNQWKLTLPLQVNYQNDKEKVTQMLNINLTVGRKINGDLGIMQLVAMPSTAITNEPTSGTVQPANTTANPTQPQPAINQPKPATPATTQ